MPLFAENCDTTKPLSLRCIEENLVPSDGSRQTVSARGLPRDKQLAVMF
jgi:hypothetical protein